jgi:SAM-dependent methyltransferase
MIEDYNNDLNAAEYINFLTSTNGQIQQKVLWEAIKNRLPKNALVEILDAACGSGWLTKSLSQNYPNSQGCDISEALIKSAKKEYRGIGFKIANLEKPLPYSTDFFDVIIINMAAPDISELVKSFKNIFDSLKPTGQLIITIPNPYYTFPVGVWKRSLLDFILDRKPKLLINHDYNHSQNIVREFNNGKTKISSNFYPLSEYIIKARSGGFTLVDIEELRSEKDSPNFDLNYQLYRYPLLLLLEFAKPGI